MVGWLIVGGLPPFARQMMHKDWFADVDEYQRIKGDNLREYNGYLATTDYTHWDSGRYNKWLNANCKTKLSAELSDKFLRLCM